MPLIRVQTNVSANRATIDSLIKSLSFNTAEILNKPESYMMIIVEPDTAMAMSLLTDPTAFIEVRAVGEISEENAKNLCGKLSEILGKELGVGAGRIYVNCVSVPGEMWGFDGRTFG